MHVAWMPILWLVGRLLVETSLESNNSIRLWFNFWVAGQTGWFSLNQLRSDDYGRIAWTGLGVTLARGRWSRYNLLDRMLGLRKRLGCLGLYLLGLCCSWRRCGMGCVVAFLFIGYGCSGRGWWQPSSLCGTLRGWKPKHIGSVVHHRISYHYIFSLVTDQRTLKKFSDRKFWKELQEHVQELNQAPIESTNLWLQKSAVFNFDEFVPTK